MSTAPSAHPLALSMPTGSAHPLALSMSTVSATGASVKVTQAVSSVVIDSGFPYRAPDFGSGPTYTVHPFADGNSLGRSIQTCFNPAVIHSGSLQEVMSELQPLIVKVFGLLGVQSLFTQTYSTGILPGKFIHSEKWLNLCEHYGLKDHVLAATNLLNERMKEIGKNIKRYENEINELEFRWAGPQNFRLNKGIKYRQNEITQLHAKAIPKPYAPTLLANLSTIIDIGAWMGYAPSTIHTSQAPRLMEEHKFVTKLKSTLQKMVALKDEVFIESAILNASKDKPRAETVTQLQLNKLKALKEELKSLKNKKKKVVEALKGNKKEKEASAHLATIEAMLEAIHERGIEIDTELDLRARCVNIKAPYQLSPVDKTPPIVQEAIDLVSETVALKEVMKTDKRNMIEETQAAFHQHYSELITSHNQKIQQAEARKNLHVANIKVLLAKELSFQLALQRIITTLNDEMNKFHPLISSIYWPAEYYRDQSLETHDEKDSKKDEQTTTKTAAAVATSGSATVASE